MIDDPTAAGIQKIKQSTKSMSTFESMDLFAPIKRALAEEKYETPTPIQAQTIPAAIEGQDILGCAQTGTGKTAAFALPILDFLGHEKPPLSSKHATALVLAPTRELAIQIGESFKVYGKHMRFRSALVYGGVGQAQQVKAMRTGVDVLIATPGRLLDLMQQGHISLANVEILVLDEADRMLDMGFMPALKKIIAELPKERQSLFFSATLPPKIRELSQELLFNPISVNVTPKTTSVQQIQQSVRIVPRGDKVALLSKTLKSQGVDQTIVFTRTKHGANALTRKLEKEGIAAVAIHGNKTQNARQKALDAFRRKKVTVLVATDVAARGIDIDGVSHVINFDMPNEPESYVHRIGRTGRAGAEGVAISYCMPDEREILHAVESLIGQKLTIENPEVKFVSGKPVATGGQTQSRGRSGNRRNNFKSSGFKKAKKAGHTGGPTAYAKDSGKRRHRSASA
ncbi:DEAD/DEAH box helicase [Stieleria varia]